MGSSESDSSSRVKDLQATLFPATPKNSGSYFSNFILKSTFHEENNDDNQTIKLREIPSREIYLLNRDSNFIPQLPRWPTECQVIEEKITHIQYTPSYPEPYYVPSGEEVQPKPTGEECGIVVYQYIPISALNYFNRSSIGGSRYLLNSILCPEENSLRFESRFESGNLAKAIRITENYYELFLRSDLYTSRHTQWFYFRIKNMKKNFLYRFSIVNFSKEESLYNEGMKPLMYSVKDSQLHSIGWRRCGDNIIYYSNDNISPDDPDQTMTYTLTFTVEFPHDDDEVYLAHCYPYTYSDLEEYLTTLSNHPVKSTFTTVRLLCKSIAGNNVHIVTVTSPYPPSEIKDNYQKKRAIVISARVHPGETPSSWIMKGILDFLTSETIVAKELRDKFIFKIVPMLNPDGVIVGNNRCSLSGKDLNRQYRTVLRDTYPTIWYTKLMVRRLLEECGVALYCDLHAHSRKHNIFVYGCENRRNSEMKLKEQVFPLMLHKNTPDKFNFEDCKFRITKAKEGTGRVVMWMMGIANSYTMEATFAGSLLGNRTETHFSTYDLEQMGKSFCQTLLDFYDDDPRKEKLKSKIITRLLKQGSNADEPTNIPLSDFSSDEGDTSSTSSNEVGHDDELINIPIVPPPTPNITYKKKMKVKFTKTKLLTKSPNIQRKPLLIHKASLGMISQQDISLSDSSQSDDDDNDDDDNDDENKIQQIEKFKNTRKRRKKKRIIKTKSSNEIKDQVVSVPPSRTVSVYNIVPPNNKYSIKNSNKKSKTLQPKTVTIQEKKISVSQQLAQVQIKLISLKNKLWLGTGGSGDEPLSWGTSKFTYMNTKKDKKKRIVYRNDGKIKLNTDTKKKTFNNVKQTMSNEGKLRKTTSLLYASLFKSDDVEDDDGGGGGEVDDDDDDDEDEEDEEEEDEKENLDKAVGKGKYVKKSEKKKKKKRFTKKAKVISRAKIFFNNNNNNNKKD